MERPSKNLRANATKITPRHREILEGLSKRLTLKEIAAEVGITESAVNQHIRTIKRRIGANTLRELSEAYQAIPAADEDCRKSACRKSQLTPDDLLAEAANRNGAEPSLTFHDSLSYPLEAPWTRFEPSVVPRVLDGDNAVWVRALAMLGIPILILAAALVALGVAEGITDALPADWAGPRNSN